MPDRKTQGFLRVSRPATDERICDCSQRGFADSSNILNCKKLGYDREATVIYKSLHAESTKGAWYSWQKTEDQSGSPKYLLACTWSFNDMAQCLPCNTPQSYCGHPGPNQLAVCFRATEVATYEALIKKTMLDFQHKSAEMIQDFLPWREQQLPHLRFSNLSWQKLQLALLHRQAWKTFHFSEHVTWHDV